MSCVADIHNWCYIFFNEYFKTFTPMYIQFPKTASLLRCAVPLDGPHHHPAMLFTPSDEVLWNALAMLCAFPDKAFSSYVNEAVAMGGCCLPHIAPRLHQLKVYTCPSTRHLESYGTQMAALLSNAGTSASASVWTEPLSLSPWTRKTADPCTPCPWPQLTVHVNFSFRRIFWGATMDGPSLHMDFTNTKTRSTKMMTTNTMLNFTKFIQTETCFFFGIDPKGPLGIVFLRFCLSARNQRVVFLPGWREWACLLSKNNTVWLHSDLSFESWLIWCISHPFRYHRTWCPGPRPWHISGSERYDCRP